MKITKDKVVSIAYDLEVKDEEGNFTHVEKVEQEEPMVFIFGQSGLPEKFENELAGKNSGDNFEFSVSSEEAYGDIDEEAFVKFPLDMFKADGNFDAEAFAVGTVVPMSDPDGNILKGKVISVSDQDLEMDFNHPLAGYDLYFKGTVTEVREATAEELDHGHVHGPGGHQH